ncbi:MAG: ABC transporter ATP-binding protein [Acidimicrobiales bacterium]
MEQVSAAAPAHPAAPPGPGLSVEGISKSFGPVRALDRVTVAVPPGEVVAVMGHNGAGKSTLIRILATSVVPDDGRVWIGGVDAVASPEQARRHVGLVQGEDRSHFWRLDGRQNLEFFAAMHGMTRRRARAAADEALEAVGLTDVAQRRVDRYSTGMRSRLGIARALLGTPSVLLLDEPTRSLDPGSTVAIRELVCRVAAERRVAVLIATHDLHEAAAMASEVVILSQGRVADARRGPLEAASLEVAVLATLP